tara:strand:+ start:90 stop:1166 length:1077 start_codon:yes stop_codon:yes gene_type:complete
MQRNNIIDLLRLFAITGVFSIHYIRPEYVDHTLIQNFIHHGKYGVSLFFVISGYVLCLITKKYNFLSLILSRFARILICGYLIILLINPHNFFITSLNCLELFKLNNIDFTPWFFSLSTEPRCLPNPAAGVQWTLAVELQYYLFFGLTLFFIIKNFSKTNLKYKFIFISILLFFIFLISFRQVYDHLFFALTNKEIYGYRNHIFVTHFEAFFSGIIVYLLTFYKLNKLNFYSTAFIFLIIVMVNIFLLVNGEYIYSKPLISFISAATLIIATTENFISKSKIINNNFFGTIGRSTYVFYLLHISLKDNIEKFLNKIFNDNLHLFELILFSYFTLILLSVIIYLLIDRPIQKTLNKYIK